MSDPLDAVDFAYVRWRNNRNYGFDNDATVSPQGVGEIELNEDSLPFLKIAVIRRYLNEYGNRSLGQPVWKDS